MIILMCDLSDVHLVAESPHFLLTTSASYAAKMVSEITLPLLCRMLESYKKII